MNRHGARRRLPGMKTQVLHAALEPKLVALYEAVFDDVEIGPGTRLLDVGCEAGLFLRLAAQRGAAVTGTQAIERLPYDSASFDVVTGFNAFQLASDPVSALREAARVARSGAPVVAAVWGRRERCEAAAPIEAVHRLVPGGSAGPFALSGQGALRRLTAAAGLGADEPQDVLCVWDFDGDEALLQALTSTREAAAAAQHAGEEKVVETVLDAVAPYRTSGGGYRLENECTYIVARA